MIWMTSNVLSLSHSCMVSAGPSSRLVCVWLKLFQFCKINISQKMVLLGIRSKSYIQLHKLFRVIHYVDMYLWSVLKVAAEKCYGLHVMLYYVTCGTGIIFKQPRLTHGGRDKLTSNSMTTFSITFSWMKIFKSRLRFIWIPRKHKWSR